MSYLECLCRCRVFNREPDLTASREHNGDLRLERCQCHARAFEAVSVATLPDEDTPFRVFFGIPWMDANAGALRHTVDDRKHAPEPLRLRDVNRIAPCRN